MTPQIAGISVPGVNFSQPKPQKSSFFTDFGSDLRKKQGISGQSVFSRGGIKIKSTPTYLDCTSLPRQTSSSYRIVTF
jgi:hypothetical protein